MLDALIDIEDGVQNFSFAFFEFLIAVEFSITASLLLLAVQIEIAGVVRVICWFPRVPVVFWTGGGGGEVLNDSTAPSDAPAEFVATTR